MGGGVTGRILKVIGGGEEDYCRSVYASRLKRTGNWDNGCLAHDEIQAGKQSITHKIISPIQLNTN